MLIACLPHSPSPPCVGGEPNIQDQGAPSCTLQLESMLVRAVVKIWKRSSRKESMARGCTSVHSWCASFFWSTSNVTYVPSLRERRNWEGRGDSPLKSDNVWSYTINSLIVGLETRTSFWGTWNRINETITSCCIGPTRDPYPFKLFFHKAKLSNIFCSKKAHKLYSPFSFQSYE